jgi:CubicO group peptidase (beta-lactamase class C family)
MTRPYLLNVGTFTLLALASACSGSMAELPWGEQDDAEEGDLTVLAAPLVAVETATPAETAEGDLGFGEPDEVGMDARPLLALTDWIGRSRAPVLSLVVSKDGRVVYELYTSGATREDAHYWMGVTAGVTSALVGVVMDRGLVAGPDVRISDVLPADLFPSESARARFRDVTLADVLAMSALDAPIPPEDTSPPSVALGDRFRRSKDRVRFALEQPLVESPGTTFRLSELTPEIAVGVVQYATGKSAFDLAREALFDPMGFRHEEWLYEDADGQDTGAYGLRARPVDMQKLGLLYLHDGIWGGRRLLSSEWIRTSFTPRVRRGSAAYPNYGAYWNTMSFGDGIARDANPRRFVAHVLAGWKGQRVAVFPEDGLVVTMTGVFDPSGDAGVFSRILREFILPSISGPDVVPDPALRVPLHAMIEAVRAAPSPLPVPVERRLAPSVAPKGPPHRPFRPR